MPARVAFYTLLLLVVAVPATAQLNPLSGGRRASFKDNADPSRAKGSIVFAKDAGLVLFSPLCPAATTLQLSSSTQTNPLIELPCSLWQPRGTGFLYRDKLGLAGGVIKIRYAQGKLIIKARGAAFDPITGPVDYVDVRFGIDSEAFCGRFSVLKKNTAAKVSAAKPSGACETVCGDGIADPTEPCDDGNAADGDGCDTNCLPSGCGNGIVTAGEDCDDGNATAGDGCRDDCTIEQCGDGILDPQDECDDGNLVDGDCCSSTCTAENGSPCSDGDHCTTGDVCVGSTCVGTVMQPWINEFDYDDFALGGNTDRDEFVEIAGPAGTDLSSYKIVAVEGNASCAYTVFSGVATGEANFLATIPPGTVLADDTGLGVGLYVVCFTNTSARHVNAGECDVVVPAPSIDTNLQNGNLVNSNPVDCPDGVLLLAPDDTLADAVSYEGIVPNVGNFGPYFHVTPYSAGVDQGFKTGVSFEKTTDTGRATSAAEWRLTGGCVDASLGDATCVEFSDSPGEVNPGQELNCPELYCGDGLVTGVEDCDEGSGNSDAPDATCRSDCSERRCGDGIIDPGFGEACELDDDCAVGESCYQCDCVVGTVLGEKTFTVVPGPSESAPVDDGESSWLRVSQIVAGISSGTQGDFTPGPLVLEGGLAGLDGIASLVLKQPAYIGATAPAAGGGGTVCFRYEQDPDATGFIDCDGGTPADVEILVNSNGAAADDAPVLNVGTGVDAGAGAAVVRVIVKGALLPGAGENCATADYSADAGRATAFTTATGRSTIFNPRQGGALTGTSLTGVPFDCASWATDVGASIVAPNLNMDVPIPILGDYDLAQALRLNDD
jgi:cysteine-rich repeat protein